MNGSIYYNTFYFNTHPPFPLIFLKKKIGRAFNDSMDFPVLYQKDEITNVKQAHIC